MAKKISCKPTNCKPKNRSESFLRSRAKIALVICALLIVIGGGVLATQAWTSPGDLGYTIQDVNGVPTPSGNVSGLLTTGSNAQIKTGGLSIMSNVGIGTTTPGARLHIVGATNEALRIDRVSGMPSIKSGSADGYMIIDSSGQQLKLNNYVADDIILASGGGKVGIATNAPRTKEEISYATGGTLPNVNWIGQTLYRSDASSNAYVAALALLAYQNKGLIFAGGGYGGSIYTYDGSSAPAERFRIDAATGNVSIGAGLTVNGKNVCLADGTNCPSSGGGMPPPQGTSTINLQGSSGQSCNAWILSLGWDLTWYAPKTRGTGAYPVGVGAEHCVYTKIQLPQNICTNESPDYKASGYIPTYHCGTGSYDIYTDMALRYP